MVCHFAMNTPQEWAANEADIDPWHLRSWVVLVPINICFWGLCLAEGHQVLYWFGMRTCIPSAKRTKKAWKITIFNGKIDYKWVMINNSNNYVSVYRGYVEWLMDLAEHIVDVDMTTQLGSTLQLRCCKGMLCPAGQQAWYAKNMRKWPYKNCHLWLIYPSDWWFQTFFIFPYIGNNQAFMVDIPMNHDDFSVIFHSHFTLPDPDANHGAGRFTYIAGSFLAWM